MKRFTEAFVIVLILCYCLAFILDMISILFRPEPKKLQHPVMSTHSSSFGTAGWSSFRRSFALTSAMLLNRLAATNKDSDTLSTKCP